VSLCFSAIADCCCFRFYRGDLLFLWMPKDEPRECLRFRLRHQSRFSFAYSVLFLFLRHQVRVGEITVFKLNEREIPIVHRVMNVHERPQVLPSGKPNKVREGVL
jgi:hypothetical protein